MLSSVKSEHSPVLQFLEILVPNRCHCLVNVTWRKLLEGLSLLRETFYVALSCIVNW